MVVRVALAMEKKVCKLNFCDEEKGPKKLCYLSQFPVVSLSAGGDGAVGLHHEGAVEAADDLRKKF